MCPLVARYGSIHHLGRSLAGHRQHCFGLVWQILYSGFQYEPSKILLYFEMWAISISNCCFNRTKDRKNNNLSYARAEHLILTPSFFDRSCTFKWICNVYWPNVFKSDWNQITFYRNHYSSAYGFAHAKIYMECVYTFIFVNHCMYIQWPNIATYFALNHVDRVATIQPLKCRNTHTLKQL